MNQAMGDANCRSPFVQCSHITDEVVVLQLGELGRAPLANEVRYRHECGTSASDLDSTRQAAPPAGGDRRSAVGESGDTLGQDVEVRLPERRITHHMLLEEQQHHHCLRD